MNQDDERGLIDAMAAERSLDTSAWVRSVLLTLAKRSAKKNPKHDSESNSDDEQ